MQKSHKPPFSTRFSLLWGLRPLFRIQPKREIFFSHQTKMSSSDGRSDKGLLWKLPVVKSKDLGRLGPGIGFGAGCGVGVGAGLFGGAGLGAGFPGLQIGIGIGAGCGIGLGFGYGLGKGIAYDENKQYSNVGKLFRRTGSGTGKFPNQDHIDALLDDLIVNTKKLIKATSKELEKWR